MKKSDVYFLNTHTKNQKDKGYRLVVTPKFPRPSDVDDDLDEAVLKTLFNLKPSAVYEVGYGMGKLLASLKLLLPNAKVGGCDTQDLNRAFAKKHFYLEGVHLDVKELPYHELNPDETFDDENVVVFCVDTLNKMSEDIWSQVLAQMYSVTGSNGIVVIAEPESFYPEEIYRDCVVQEELVDGYRIVVMDLSLLLKEEKVRGERANHAIVADFGLEDVDPEDIKLVDDLEKEE